MRTSNVERPTSNFEVEEKKVPLFPVFLPSMLDVGRWTLDVRVCSAHRVAETTAAGVFFGIWDLGFGISFGFGVSDFGFKPGRWISDLTRSPYCCFRLIRSIGHCVSRTHSICFTAHLQKNALSDTSSVTMHQFNATALNHPLASSGTCHPPRYRGVGPTDGLHRSQYQARAAAMLGGQLQPPGLHAVDPAQRGDARGNAAATQTFGHRPQCFDGRLRPQDQQPMDRHAHRHQCGGIQIPGWIAPGDPAEF